MLASTSLVSADWETSQIFFESCALSYHWSFRIHPFLCSKEWGASEVERGLGKFPISLSESDGYSAPKKD